MAYKWLTNGGDPNYLTTYIHWDDPPSIPRMPDWSVRGSTRAALDSLAIHSRNELVENLQIFGRSSVVYRVLIGPY